MTPALKLAKECGVLFISETEGIETFYRRAQAQALREAADQAAWKQTQDYLNQLADELENQK
jgi:hypothetical protein